MLLGDHGRRRGEDGHTLYVDNVGTQHTVWDLWQGSVFGGTRTHSNVYVCCGVMASICLGLFVWLLWWTLYVSRGVVKSVDDPSHFDGIIRNIHNPLSGSYKLRDQTRCLFCESESG